MWGQDELVAVGEMIFDEIVEESPFETGPISPVEPEPVATHLYATFVVDYPELRCQLDVVLRLEGVCWLRTFRANDLVGFLAACHDVIGRDVGQLFEDLPDPIVGLAEVDIERFDALGYLSHLTLYLGRVFPFLLHRGNLGRHLVPLFAEGVDRRDQLAPPSIPTQEVGEVDLVHSLEKSLPNGVRILADDVDVQHSV